MLEKSKLKPPSTVNNAFGKQTTPIQIIPVAISMDEGETPRATNNNNKTSHNSSSTINRGNKVDTIFHIVEESPKSNSENNNHNETTKGNNRQHPNKIRSKSKLLAHKQLKQKREESPQQQRPIKSTVSKKQMSTLIDKLGGPPQNAFTKESVGKTTVASEQQKENTAKELSAKPVVSKKEMGTLIEKLGGPPAGNTDYPFPKGTTNQVQSVLDSSLFSLASSEDISIVGEGQQDITHIPNSLSMSSFSVSSFDPDSPFFKQRNDKNNANPMVESSLLMTPSSPSLLRHRNATLVKEIRFAEQTCVELSLAKQQQDMQIKQLEIRLKEEQENYVLEAKEQEERHNRLQREELQAHEMQLQQQRDDMKRDYDDKLKMQSQILHEKLKEDYQVKLQEQLLKLREELESEHESKLQKQLKLVTEEMKLEAEILNEELLAKNDKLSLQLEELQKTIEQPSGISPARELPQSSRRPDPSCSIPRELSFGDDNSVENHESLLKEQQEIHKEEFDQERMALIQEKQIEMEKVVSNLEEQHEQALFQQKKQLQAEFQQMLQTVKDSFLRKATSLETQVLSRFNKEQRHLSRLQEKVGELKKKEADENTKPSEDNDIVVQELEQALASAHDDIQYQLETIAMLEHQLQEHEQKLQTLKESFSQEEDTSEMEQLRSQNQQLTLDLNKMEQQLKAGNHIYNAHLEGTMEQDRDCSSQCLREENVRLRTKLQEMEQQSEDQMHLESQFRQLESLLMNQDAQKEGQEQLTQLKEENLKLAAIVHEKEQQLQDQAALEDQFQSSLHGEILQLQEDLTISETERETLLQEHEVQIKTLREENAQLMSIFADKEQQWIEQSKLDNDTQVALQQDIVRLQNTNDVLKAECESWGQTEDQLKLHQLQIQQIHERQDQQTAVLQGQISQLQLRNTQLSSSIQEKEQQLKDQTEIDCESQLLLQGKIGGLKKELQTQQELLAQKQLQHSAELQMIEERHNQKTETLCETISQLEMENGELEDLVKEKEQQLPMAILKVKQEVETKQIRLEETKSELMHVKTLHTNLLQEAEKERRQHEHEIRNRKSDYALLQADYATCHSKLTAAMDEISRNKEALSDCQKSSEEAIKLCKDNVQAKLQPELLSLRDELEQTHQEHRRQLESLKRLKAEAEDNLRLVTNERDEARSDRHSLVILQSQLKETIERKDEEIAQLQEKQRLLLNERECAYNDLQQDRENSLDTLNASIHLKDEEIKNMKNKITSLKTEKSKLCTEVDDLNTQLRIAEEKLSETEVTNALDSFNQTLDGMISEVRENLSNADVACPLKKIENTGRKSWRDKLDYAIVIVTEIKKALRKSSDELLERRDKITQLQRRTDQADSKLEQYYQREKQQEMSTQNLQNQLFDAKNEIQKASSEIGSTSKDLLEANEALERMQEAFDEKASHCKNLEKDRDGVQREVAFLSGKLEESSRNQ